MHYVGLGVHARRSSVRVPNADGEAIRQIDFRGDQPALCERVAAGVPRPFAVATEPNCGYGYPHGRPSALAGRVAAAGRARRRREDRDVVHAEERIGGREPQVRA